MKRFLAQSIVTSQWIYLHSTNMYSFAVSVCKLSWFSEEKRFAVGYSDGQIWLTTKDGYVEDSKVIAHKVSPSR